MQIGFMQGRLSPLVDGKIQAFPWDTWHDEFRLAAAFSFPLMEWTLDQERIAENPIMTETGRQRIRSLSEQYGLAIASLTGDCFMQAPFWKATGGDRGMLEETFDSVAHCCHKAGVSMIVVPLVDNGSLETRGQEDHLVDFLLSRRDDFEKKNLRIIFESDYRPDQLAAFMDRLGGMPFGVNYDIGNSAALGFHPSEEFSQYGSHIVNVHVKDRAFGGTTVPLGTGDSDFEAVFQGLADLHYHGNFILQTARAADGDHGGVLRKYRDMVDIWIAGFNVGDARAPRGGSQTST